MSKVYVVKQHNSVFLIFGFYLFELFQGVLYICVQQTIFPEFYYTYTRIFFLSFRIFRVGPILQAWWVFSSSVFSSDNYFTSTPFHMACSICLTPFCMFLLHPFAVRLMARLSFAVLPLSPSLSAQRPLSPQFLVQPCGLSSFFLFLFSFRGIFFHFSFSS